MGGGWGWTDEWVKLEKEEKEREEAGLCVCVPLLGAAPQTVLPVYCEGLCLFVCPSRDVTGWEHTPKWAVYSRSGSGSGNGQRELPGKKTRGNPGGSMRGNEPRGRGPDGRRPLPAEEPWVGTTHRKYDIYITCTLWYLCYQQWLSTIKPNVTKINSGDKEWMITFSCEN